YSGFVTAGAVGPLLLFQQPWLGAPGVGGAQLRLWQAAPPPPRVPPGAPAGWLVSRLGERGAFVAQPATLFLCGVALAGIERAWIAGAFLGISLARGLHGPVLEGYVNRRIESKRRATVLSAQSLVRNATMACAWPLGGLVADAL